MKIGNLTVNKKKLKFIWLLPKMAQICYLYCSYPKMSKVYHLQSAYHQEPKLPKFEKVPNGPDYCSYEKVVYNTPKIFFMVFSYNFRGAYCQKLYIVAL